MFKKKQKVLVAISGGADSSAVMFLLQKQGYEVMGIFMKMGDNYQESEAAARQVCQKLKVKFFPINIGDLFQKQIIDYFVDAYARGETPNPCVKCNKLIKFGELLKWRERLGADFLASGHYVKKIFNKQTKEWEIHKAKDTNKDQTYFLYNLTQRQLPFLLFPLGDMFKSDVQAMIVANNIPILQKESMDICFLQKNGQAISQNEYLPKFIKLQSGPIKLILPANEKGKRKTKLLGQHKGLPLYTIGQRRGVDIGGTGPYYVVSMSYPQNILYVVQDFLDPLLMSSWLYSTNNTFIGNKHYLHQHACQAVVRYRHQPVTCQINFRPQTKSLKLANQTNKLADIWQTKFLEKQRAITPGQSIVWYDNNKLLGGGVIAYNEFWNINKSVV